jgi:hypothetical protein
MNEPARIRIRWSIMNQEDNRHVKNDRFYRVRFTFHCPFCSAHLARDLELDIKMHLQQKTSSDQMQQAVSDFIISKLQDDGCPRCKTSPIDPKVLRVRWEKDLNTKAILGAAA